MSTNFSQNTTRVCSWKSIKWELSWFMRTDGHMEGHTKRHTYFSNAWRKHLQMRYLASRIHACADGTVRNNPNKDTRMSFQSTNKEANKNQNIFCLVNKHLSYSIYSAKRIYDLKYFKKKLSIFNTSSPSNSKLLSFFLPFAFCIV
jgi:hypothetical protein